MSYKIALSDNAKFNVSLGTAAGVGTVMTGLGIQNLRSPYKFERRVFAPAMLGLGALNFLNGVLALKNKEKIITLNRYNDEHGTRHTLFSSGGKDIINKSVQTNKENI